MNAGAAVPREAPLDVLPSTALENAPEDLVAIASDA